MLRIARVIMLAMAGIAVFFFLRGYLRPESKAVPRIAMDAPDLDISAPANNPSEAAAPAFTFDDALALAEQGLENLNKNVVDYSARMIKQERIGTKLTDPVEMRVKIQNPGRDEEGKTLRPLRVYLLFLKPSEGREVVWGEDLFEGKLVAHEGGFMNLLRVTLDPKGVVAMTGNRYPIDHIGLTYLTEELLRRGRQAPPNTAFKVTTQSHHQVGDRECQLIRIECPPEERGLGFAQIDIAVDRENMLPLHYSSYDWPEKAGGEPHLLESYTYYDVELNRGFKDIDFSPDNPAYKFP